jgi:cytoskeletal protein CcmA (bactofilin family)
VVGNIYYQQLRMDCGASVDGKLTRQEAAQAAPPHLVAVDQPSRAEYNERDEPREPKDRKERKAG